MYSTKSPYGEAIVTLGLLKTLAYPCTFTRCPSWEGRALRRSAGSGNVRRWLPPRTPKLRSKSWRSLPVTSALFACGKLGVEHLETAKRGRHRVSVEGKRCTDVEQRAV